MKNKINNLLYFNDFLKNWKPENQKKSKRTETGLDIIKENINNNEINNKSDFIYFIEEIMKPEELIDKLKEQENWALNHGILADDEFLYKVAEEVFFGDIKYNYDYTFNISGEDAVNIILDYYE